MQLSECLALLQSASNLGELKVQYRTLLKELGFRGFIVDRSIGVPIRDFNFLEFNRKIIDFDVEGVSENLVSDDVPERYGGSADDYLEALKAATVKNFADDTGSKILRFVQNQALPFLELGISDSEDWQIRIKSLHDVNLDFGKTAFLDVLRIPQKLRSGERVNISLPVAETLSGENINLAIAVSTLYVEICDLGFEQYHSRRGALHNDHLDVQLKAREIEMFTWAVAGKTLEDIAIKQPDVWTFGFMPVSHPGIPI